MAEISRRRRSQSPASAPAFKRRRIHDNEPVPEPRGVELPIYPADRFNLTTSRLSGSQHPAAELVITPKRGGHSTIYMQIPNGGAGQVNERQSRRRVSVMERVMTRLGVTPSDLMLLMKRNRNVFGDVKNEVMREVVILMRRLLKV